MILVKNILLESHGESKKKLQSKKTGLEDEFFKISEKKKRKTQQQKAVA